MVITPLRSKNHQNPKKNCGPSTPWLLDTRGAYTKGGSILTAKPGICQRAPTPASIRRWSGGPGAKGSLLVWNGRHCLGAVQDPDDEVGGHQPQALHHDVHQAVGRQPPAFNT